MKRILLKAKKQSLRTNFKFLLPLLFLIVSSCQEKKQHSISKEEMNELITKGFKELGLSGETELILNNEDSLVKVKRNLSNKLGIIKNEAYLALDSTRIHYINRELHLGVEDFAFFRNWRIGQLDSLGMEVVWTANHKVFELSELALIGLKRDTLYFEVRQRSFAGRGDAVWFVMKNDVWVLTRIENLYVN
jgi:hypothetical protein